MPPTPAIKQDGARIYLGDCLELLREMKSNSIDSIVTDPPYGLSNTDPAHVVEALTKWANGERDFVPTGRGFMGKSWDAFVPPPAVWDECFRVLKPGGHLLSFAGSRTFDLMTLSIRFAGFDIRDGIAWLYGSGFPKSLDVSKAIDKAAGATREKVRLPGAASAYSSNAGNHRPWMDQVAADGFREVDGSDAITPEAAAWQGWGTALKPAFEPIVVARKPLVAPGVNVLSHVESSLREHGVTGEIKWTNGPVSGAVRSARRRSSSATPQRPAAGTSASPAGDSETPNAERPTGSGSVTSTPSGDGRTPNSSAPLDSEPTASSETRSLTPMGESAPAAESPSRPSSPSTTSTAAGPPTASPSTARSMGSSDDSAFLLVTESFAGTATGLTGSRATVRIDKLTDGTFVWPDGLPRTVPGGPITVAANVLAHGTGALNIDATRVEGGARPLIISKSEKSTGILGDGLNGSSHGGQTTAGRWPTNVVMDGDTADALDEQSGNVKGAVSNGRRAGNGAMFDPGDQAQTRGYADQGGASRFFPTFRYQAKAPTRERPVVTAEDGTKTAHPTVKPLALMQWLVKLVTPPGGWVLDPFTGSGTTIEAAVVEGFRPIGIERDPDYLPLIQQRLDRKD